MTPRRIQSEQDYRKSMPSTNAMNHTDCLRIVEVLEANTQLCRNILGVIAKGAMPTLAHARVRVDIEATNKLITNLKASITSKIEAEDDVHEDSGSQTTIYTPSHTESQHESNHDALDLDDQIAEPSIDTQDH